MRNPKLISAILTGAIVTASMMLIAGAMIIFPSRPTMATPDIAKSTGEPCAKCHTSPPALNDYGKKYQADNKGK